jgi:hypothetical protein
VRQLAREKGAIFGWHRLTLPQLAAVLARPLLVERNLVPVSGATAEALVTWVVQELASASALGRYAKIVSGPGFAKAVTGVLMELRLAGIAAGTIKHLAPALADILERYEWRLAHAGFADWPSMLAVARESVQRGDRHQTLGLPTVFLDVSTTNDAESALITAVCSRAPEVIVTVPVDDERTLRFFRDQAKFDLIDLDQPDERTGDEKEGSLARLQRRLFVEGLASAEGTPDDEVTVFSAPGGGRECAEIARRILDAARQGIPFDRIAVLLRSPEEYRSHLEEAFARAGIPAHFARGSIRPDPSGRAFYVLLSCAADGLSARRFAEYLSLAQVPDATADGAPPRPEPRENLWVTPDDDLAAGLGGMAANVEAAPGESSHSDAPASPVIAGQVRAPRRWERLLVEAAVIGGRERWHRRIEGLRNELRKRIEELGDEDEARATLARRTLDDLQAFAGYALPLIAALDGLPKSALWGDWLDQLGALATRALRYPDRVLAILSDLAPMAPVGPFTLQEVLLVLSHSLLEVDSNTYVARALRARYQRWNRGWSASDGLLSKSAAVRAIMAKHAFAARSYSATALQNFAGCPYRFYLYAVHGLVPREVPEAIDELDPLQRGGLIHAIQFDVFERLRDAKLLPVTSKGLEGAWEILDSVIAENAGRVRDELAPAIERVWQDGIAAIRADLREWLRRASEDVSGYVPWRFELSFGLAGRDERRSADPVSVGEPVGIDCGIRLRGSMDLVERRSDDSLRVTDHKTGRFVAKAHQLIHGGRSLQPVLYALAAENLFPERTVHAGRLYFCTSAGEFADHIVPLDDDARRAASLVAETIGNALAQPSLPAAPDQDGCDRCDYRPICGPYEALRVRRKPVSRLAALLDLRAVP